MKESILEWLINWFCENADLSREELQGNLDQNYFEKGYIDSFQFISLMSDIEEEYSMEFQNDQFEDRSFSTISGLAGIIEENGAK